MRDFGRDSVWKTKVNSFLALVCVGCVALGAWYVIWKVTFGVDPIANAMAAQIGVVDQSN